MALGIEFWALTFDTIGKILIAITALLVHRRLIVEKKIDDIVLKRMKFEISSGLIGIIFIIIGYVLHLIVLT